MSEVDWVGVGWYERLCSLAPECSLHIAHGVLNHMILMIDQKTIQRRNANVVYDTEEEEEQEEEYSCYTWSIIDQTKKLNRSTRSEEELEV